MSNQRLAPAVSDQDHVLGDDSTLVTLIEYGDFECPFCGAAYPVLKRVQERLSNRLRFVFRHFPIAQSHPHAEHAAEAAESVAVQAGDGAFWIMHNLMFEHQSALDDASLARYAEKVGADGQEVLRDLRDERYQRAVRDSFMQGVRAGVNGTPTLFIDRIRYDGPRDEETLVAALELVAERAEKPTA